MSHRRLFFIVPFLLSVAAVMMFAGCGGKSSNEDLVLAMVGDHEVTGAYYQDRLSRMEENQIPRDEDGAFHDMSTLAGKQAFLKVIINKELMVLKAKQLGYEKDTQVEMALGHLTEYNAMIYFWKDEIGDPSKFVSDDDLDYYYSRLGERRECNFLITNTREEAVKAREAIATGMPWSEAVATFHVAPLRNNTAPKLTINWGQYRDEFERPVFATAKGEVTEPVMTEHGYWLLQINEVVMDKKPDLESIKGEVVVSIAKRNENLLREDLKDAIAVAHNLFVDEEALAIVFEGLPEGESIMNPETGKPTTQDALKPLDVPTSAFSKVLLSYDMSIGPYVMTVADYKSGFDKQNVFERAKRGELLGGMRVKLLNAAEKAIMIDEARTRGYFEDERVIAASYAKVEELLVDKVQSEIVAFDEKISSEALAEFWAEHETEYFKPERRSGRMVRCADEGTAAEARASVVSGELTWKQVNKRLGNDPDLEQIFGRIVQMKTTETGPIRDMLFSLSVDGICEPFEVPGGWAVVQLTKVYEQTQPTLDEAAEMVGARIRNIRMEEALQALLAEWREEFGVTIFEDALAEMLSWEEAVRATSEAQAAKIMG